MRWDELFADLAGQLADAEAADLAGEVADRSRREQSVLTLVDRARAAVGRDLRLRLTGVGFVPGTLVEVGADWLLLRDGAGRQVLVPWPAVLAVSGLGPAATEPEDSGQVFRRLRLTAALRALSRDRSEVTATLVDGSVVAGTIDRVGGDFVEVGEHAVGEARRARDVTGVRTIAHTALAMIAEAR